MPGTGETIAFAVIATAILGSALAAVLAKRTFHSVMFLGAVLVAMGALFILLGSPLIGVIQILVYVGGILTLFVFAVMFVAGDEKEAMEEAPAPAPRSRAWTMIAGVLVAGGALYVASAYVVKANHWAAGLLGAHADAAGKWVANELQMAAGFVAGVLFIALVAVGAILAWLGIRHALDSWSGTRILGVAVAGVLAGAMVAVVAGASPCAKLVCMDPSANWGATSSATDDGVAAANDLGTVVASLFGPNAVAFEVLGVLLTAVMIGALVLARPLAAPADEDHYARITPEQLRESQMASDVRLHATLPSPVGARPANTAADAGPQASSVPSRPSVPSAGPEAGP